LLELRRAAISAWRGGRRAERLLCGMVASVPARAQL